MSALYSWLARSACRYRWWFLAVWLVVLGAPAAGYGPQWAGLMVALGVGAMLGARPGVARRPVLAVLAVALVGACVGFSTSRVALLVVGAQIVVIGVLAIIGVPLAGRLHDGIPSALRAGVTSGTSTLSWLAFLPLSLVFGFVGDSAGVFGAGAVLSPLFMSVVRARWSTNRIISASTVRYC